MLGILDDLPRASLCHAPTPLEPMPNLGREIGLAGGFVKRDDCTGMAFGGNKLRQLEFYLGQAVAEEADVILITGAVQSNFVRQAAAGANRLGMQCHVQLEQRVPKTDPAYNASGNVLIDRLLGATIHYYAHGEDEVGADRELEVIADRLRSEGHKPYVIHLAAGHKPLGALGYVVCARELLAQIEAQDIAVDEFVVPSGSGATHAGFLFGLRALGCNIPVNGICVRRNADAQRERLISRCEEIAEMLQLPNPVSDADIILNDDVLAPGYGLLNLATNEAIAIGARTESLMLDPVYTGKSMAGFIASARAAPERTLLYLHTGGAPTLFAYATELTEALVGAT